MVGCFSVAARTPTVYLWLHSTGCEPEDARLVVTTIDAFQRDRQAGRYLLAMEQRDSGPSLPKMGLTNTRVIELVARDLD